MAICKNRKIIYIHPSKCAGKTIENAIFGFKEGSKSDHKSLYDYSKIVDIEDYFVFTTIRNPWKRMVSMFFDIIYRTVPGRYIESDFNNAIRAIKKNNGFVPLVGKKLSSGPIVEMMKINGKIRCNKFLKVSDLEKDLFEISDKTLFKGNIEKLNSWSWKRTHYSKYYEDDTIEIIRDIFQEDILFFGFKFEDRR